MNSMKKTVKPAKGMIPAGYANGGRAKPFSGKDTRAEEMAEAKAVRSGRMTAKEYAAAERREERMEGEKQQPRAALLRRGKDLASGKMSAKDYGATVKKANGGRVMKKGC